MADAKINLLIVDDEEQFLESKSKSLQVRDFNVIAVNRGEKAIEEKKMDELLKISLAGSPREILRKLREIDKG